MKNEYQVITLRNGYEMFLGENQLEEINKEFIKNGVIPYEPTRKVEASKAEVTKQNAQFPVVVGLINDKLSHTYEDSDSERPVEEIFKSMFW